ncbi:MAG: glycerophosphodiester phosphodiesterase family protein [Mycobacterium sp.]|uniref:glycerophosphodiester phosphodiesterase family protein n=1 Tax=Mycobacterium sp. TaxID=1785 RepID=UPI002605A43F|nr:glycerophosphodiester phosphodiesterase family protein [Mycobacterium sp.]MDI3313588.1 glycerophosphodiester phosphodiesterase family protein [Mycobacterium sp.]
MAAVAVLPGPPAPAAPAAFDLVAHQGGQGEATGESLRAFAKSLELGVSTLEFDVVITKDGQPLVWHDQRIVPEKCADTGPVLAGDPQYPYVGKLVRDLTLEQLRTLDCGRPTNEFPCAEVVRGNKIATLPEVFALTDSYRANVRYDIETKVDAEHPGASADPREFVDVIVAAARSAGKLDRVDIESFDWRVLSLVHQEQPSIPVAALWNEKTWTPDSPWLAGIDPAVIGDPVVGAMMAGANILSPGYSVPSGQTTGDPGFTLVADKTFVDRAHALGLKVIPWTINDADTMRAQIAAGADGIITDYPALLRTVMAGDGMPLPRAYHRE